jgi:hypothetical protein
MFWGQISNFSVNSNPARNLGQHLCIVGVYWHLCNTSDQSEKKVKPAIAGG